MNNSQLEQRVKILEEQMQQVLTFLSSKVSPGPATRTWRQSLGMFTDHPTMKLIDHAGDQIRRADRDQPLPLFPLATPPDP